MKRVRTAFPALWVATILMLPAGSAAAQNSTSSTSTNTSAKTDARVNVRLDAPTLQATVDRLFGTPDGGLLDGTKPFEFRAENVTLTSAEAATFFTSSSLSTTDLADLVRATETVHGVVRIEGTIDSQPFELKIAGHEMKIEGLTLTSAQRDALVTDLRTISDLHEVKIKALVDGQMSVTQVAGGHERIQLLRTSHDTEAQDRDNKGALKDLGKAGRDGKVEVESNTRADVVGQIERVERPQQPERLERPEKPGVLRGLGVGRD